MVLRGSLENGLYVPGGLMGELAGLVGQTLDGQICKGAWHLLNPFEDLLLKWSDRETKLSRV